MKTYDYIIVLERPNYALVDRISRLMLMIAIAVFGYTVVRTWSFPSLYHALLVLLIAGIIGWVIRCYRVQKKGEMPFYRLALSFATIGMGMLFQVHWITFLYFMAVISEKQVKFPQEVAFDNEGIVINSFPKKRHLWSEIQNVVLKDGILTIDFRNNKLIQKPIESHTSAREEQEFNEFCNEKLNTQRETFTA